jgi:hypothetical protein
VRALRARGEARPGWGDFGPSKASAYTSNNYITPSLVTLFTELSRREILGSAHPAYCINPSSRMSGERSRTGKSVCFAYDMLRGRIIMRCSAYGCPPFERIESLHPLLRFRVRLGNEGIGEVRFEGAFAG